MPWYRRNSADHPTNPLDWVTIANLYRKNSDGNWIKIRRAYRKNSATGSPPNEWIIVHDSDSLTPYVTAAPTLTSNYGSESIFEDGDTITLTRGTWANTGSSYAPVSYSLKIQYSTDNSNWTDAVTGTGTSISYTISLSDVRSPSYYFRGRVTATNVNGSSTYNTGGVLSNMYLTVDSFSASIVNNQIYSVWTLNKSNNTSNIYEQRYSIITNSTYTYNGITYYAGQTVYETTVPVGTNSFMVPTGTNIKPGESHYAKLVVTANDTIGSEAFGFSSNFLAPFVAGTISITPSFSSLNGNRRVESGSTVTAVPENWPSGTTFTYEWYRTRSFSLQDDIFLGTGSTTSITTSSSTTGERIYVNAYATYSNGQTASVVFSEYHRIIPAPPTYTLGGGGSSITITSLTAVGGEFYFGTYSGPTSGTIPETAIGIDYTIPNLSTGTYTITLFSRATNGSGSSLVTTESNTGTSQSKSIVALNPPTPTSATYSNGTFYIYFSGGSGPYYQVWYNTSTSPGINNPTALGVTTYDFNGSSSPISWTPSAPSLGTTYNFWIRSSNSLTTTTPGDYSTWSTAYVQATPIATAPTATSVSGSAGNLNVYFSGGSGPYYQVYWYPGDRSDIQTVTTYDATGSSSPINVTNLSVPTAGLTYYFWVRSVSNQTTTGTSSSIISPWSNSVTWTAPVLAPTNATIPTLSPTSISIGTQLTAGVGTWNNSPTSYDLRIYRGTAGVTTGETLVASTTSSTTLNYTVTQSDYTSGQRYFRTYVNASNSGGSSGFIAGQERGPISDPLSSPTITNVIYSSSTFYIYFSGGSGTYYQVWYQPNNSSLYGTVDSAADAYGTSSPITKFLGASSGTSYSWWIRAANSATATGSGNVSAWNGPYTITPIAAAPGTPTSVNTSSSGLVTWSASSGVVQDYTVEYYLASNSSGSNAVGPYYSSPNPTGTSYQITYQTINGILRNYARARVRANNSGGSSAYSGFSPASGYI